MSTNGIESWAVDLAKTTAVYPFQGMEFILFLAGVAFWIWWHVVQFRQEKREIDHVTDASDLSSKSKDLIDKY